MKFLALFVLIVCTLTIVSVSASKHRCEPGSRFKIDCNECICSRNGKSAICTLMACPPRRPWGPLYVQGTPCPRKNFYSECNRCTCGNDGKSAVCTLMACEPFQQD